MGTFALPSADHGPWMWKFSAQLLENPVFVGLIQGSLIDFNYQHPLNLWETFKISVQTFSQQMLKFQLKQ